MHIAGLRANGFVIEPSQWGDVDVQFLLTPENSYAGRDRNSAERREAMPEAAAATP